MFHLNDAGKGDCEVSYNSTQWEEGTFVYEIESNPFQTDSFVVRMDDAP